MISPAIITRMRTHTNRILIATAADVARPGCLTPIPHPAAGTAHRPRSVTVATTRTLYRSMDGERPGEFPLRVYCHSHNCDATAIRHALQQATGLWLCRCDACFTAFRAGQPPPGANATPLQGAKSALDSPKRTDSHLDPQKCPKRRSEPLRAGPGQRYETPTPPNCGQPRSHPRTGPAPHHPAAQWLVERDLWPAGEPLPEAVRWLACQPSQIPPTANPIAPLPARW